MLRHSNQIPRRYRARELAEGAGSSAGAYEAGAKDEARLGGSPVKSSNPGRSSAGKFGGQANYPFANG